MNMKKVLRLLPVLLLTASLAAPLNAGADAVPALSGALEELARKKGEEEGEVSYLDGDEDAPDEGATDEGASDEDASEGNALEGDGQGVEFDEHESFDDVDEYEENNDGDDTYVSNNGTVFRIPRVDDTSLHVYDYADCFTDEQEAALREQIAKIEDRIDSDIVLLTSNDVPEDANYASETSMRYCRQFYIDNNFAEDGFCFLIDLNNRVMWLAGHGKYATDKYVNLARDLYEAVLPDAKKGDYFSVALLYLKQMDKIGNMMAAAVPTFLSLVISAGLALLSMLGFIIFHKSAQPSKSNRPAIKVNDYESRAHRENYLGTTVTRVHIPKNKDGGGGGFSGGVSSGGFSSGGGSFSGGGGKF